MYHNPDIRFDKIHVGGCQADDLVLQILRNRERERERRILEQQQREIFYHSYLSNIYPDVDAVPFSDFNTSTRTPII